MLLSFRSDRKTYKSENFPLFSVHKNFFIHWTGNFSYFSVSGCDFENGETFGGKNTSQRYRYWEFFLRIEKRGEKLNKQLQVDKTYDRFLVCSSVPLKIIFLDSPPAERTFCVTCLSATAKGWLADMIPRVLGGFPLFSHFVSQSQAQSSKLSINVNVQCRCYRIILFKWIFQFFMSFFQALTWGNEWRVHLPDKYFWELFISNIIPIEINSMSIQNSLAKRFTWKWRQILKICEENQCGNSCGGRYRISLLSTIGTIRLSANINIGSETLQALFKQGNIHKLDNAEVVGGIKERFYSRWKSR